jgi:glutathione S-transferase
VTYRLADYLPSGNGYKVRLVRQLGRLRAGRTGHQAQRDRTREFLAKNQRTHPAARDRGYVESHAIIWFLAEDSRLVPGDALERARSWQWMCFEQYNLEPNIGTARFWISSLQKSEQELGEKLVEKRRNGHAALEVLERGLTGRGFLVGDSYSLADIALYAYTHVAPEGGFSLEAYPAIRAWCARVAAQPGHVPITSR